MGKISEGITKYLEALGIFINIHLKMNYKEVY